MLSHKKAYESWLDSLTPEERAEAKALGVGHYEDDHGHVYKGGEFDERIEAEPAIQSDVRHDELTPVSCLCAYLAQTPRSRQALQMLHDLDVATTESPVVFELSLRCLAGQSIDGWQTIAKGLGVTRQAVHKRIAPAMRRLRRYNASLADMLERQLTEQVRS